uniref:G-protein coupled receptors family 1 profile domain-containing protein n=1 Tax=Ditylenchus dipsaci TaxID=166011 RepID=A0A915E6C4_9BILA
MSLDIPDIAADYLLFATTFRPIYAEASVASTSTPVASSSSSSYAFTLVTQASLVVGAGKQLEVDDVFTSHSRSTLQLWATISQILWWTVLVVSAISIPILGHALYVMLKKYKKSNYFHFLITMIVLDLLMLLSILFNLMSDYAFAALKGSIMCKITAFITNVTSCYSNWLWVCLFAQRFVAIFFPMHRWQGKSDDEGGTLFRILDDTPKLILITGVMAAATQMWAPFLMKEVLIIGQSGSIEGAYCGPDSTLVNKDLFKWIAAVESVWTYAMPFLITVLTDLAVLVYPLNSSKRFTTISSEDVWSKKKCHTPAGAGTPVSNRRSSILSPSTATLTSNSTPHSLKIQSEDSIRQCHKRRQRAIRRCLMLATMQLLLNLPNYVLQLVDEFSNLRLTSQKFVVFYLYADALFYLLYLSQYPMLAVYIQWLHSNYTKTSGIAIHSTSNMALAGQTRPQNMGFSSFSHPATKHNSVDYSPIARKVMAASPSMVTSIPSKGCSTTVQTKLVTGNNFRRSTKRHSTGCVVLQL